MLSKFFYSPALAMRRSACLMNCVPYRQFASSANKEYDLAVIGGGPGGKFFYYIILISLLSYC